jgi:uncharacterized protein (TIGR00369 family)
MKNPLGLNAQFLELEDGRLAAEFIATDEHQSYPGRAHGGVISAILDETIGRAVQVAFPEVFGVTIELTVRFRKPVPLNVPLRAVAEITRHTKQFFYGEGQLLLEDGTVAADASARFLQLPADKLVDGGLTDQDWFDDPRPLPTQIEV